MTKTDGFSLAEFDRMIQMGDFPFPYERRVELIWGEIQEKPLASPAHEDIVDYLTLWSFENTNQESVGMRIQNSIGLPKFESCPLPDVAWVKAKRYREHRPESEDVLLIIEVADSSLIGDQRVKAGLYAQAGIAEYWIVNIPNWCVECHRDPVGATYQTVKRYNRQETLSPLAVPTAILTVRELFP